VAADDLTQPGGRRMDVHGLRECVITQIIISNEDSGILVGMNIKIAETDLLKKNTS
jgi:hypothetical protein